VLSQHPDQLNYIELELDQLLNTLHARTVQISTLWRARRTAPNVENRISGTWRFYGYGSILRGLTLQLSSTRLAGNQSNSLSTGLVLGSFVKINRE
jgi:hypothetical protein